MIDKLHVSSPYRENSVVAIAQVAARELQLDRFFTTLYLGRWKRAVQPIPLIGASLAGELGRRAFPGIPAERVVNVATLPELMHVGVRRLLGKRHAALAAGWMYRVKEKFDDAVARRVRKDHPDVLVGMYAAALESFRAMREQGALSVLNFVNSHPGEHNRYLEKLAGLRAPHHELIPDSVSQRVEAELTLADLVLVPSRFVAGQLRAHGVPPEKIVNLAYGVDLRAFHPPKRRGHEDGPLECLYVGQISHRKGVRILLEAARRCHKLPVRFRLIGPTVSSELLEDFPDNAVYEGPNLPGGVAEAMRTADLLVLPSIEDACALVVLEAMATALPVVTTTNNGSGELIEDGHDGLIIPPGDSVALVDAIVRLIENPELRDQLGMTACAKVQAAHSWESYGASVLEAIGSRLTKREFGISTCA